MLAELAEAIQPDWHGTRAAGRVERHVEILRDVAHAISPDADRPDRPATAKEAEDRFSAMIADLQANAPRTGLGAATGSFVDNLAALAGRYGSHLFVCFDLPGVPATTDELEGYFGEMKSFIRKTTGRGSTTNSLAPNLGAELVLTFHARTDKLPAGPVDPVAFREARAAIDKVESPARRRRSLVRNLDDQLERLVDRWTPDGKGAT